MKLYKNSKSQKNHGNKNKDLRHEDSQQIRTNIDGSDSDKNIVNQQQQQEQQQEQQKSPYSRQPRPRQQPFSMYSTSPPTRQLPQPHEQTNSMYSSSTVPQSRQRKQPSVYTFEQLRQNNQPTSPCSNKPPPLPPQEPLSPSPSLRKQPIVHDVDKEKDVTAPVRSDPKNFKPHYLSQSSKPSCPSDYKPPKSDNSYNSSSTLSPPSTDKKNNSNNNNNKNNQNYNNYNNNKNHNRNNSSNYNNKNNQSYNNNNYNYNNKNHNRNNSSNDYNKNNQYHYKNHKNHNNNNNNNNNNNHNNNVTLAVPTIKPKTSSTSLASEGEYKFLTTTKRDEGDGSNCDEEDNRVECMICLEKRNKKGFLDITNTCNHEKIVCRNCIRSHIGTRLDEKGDVNIICPITNCAQLLTHDNVKRLVRKEMYERFDLLLVRQELNSMPDFRWCKNPVCGSGQIHANSEYAPIVTCQNCEARSCYVHDIPWHENMSCAEYDNSRKSEETATLDYLNRETKACPKCGVRISKNGGCNHMTCKVLSCKYEFCWLCMADFDEIRKHGNDRHQPSCQFYA